MYVFIGIIIFILIYIIYEYNHFIKLLNNVNRSKSGIDVYLSQRFSLIPNLVSCVKQFSIYEENVLDTITKNRSKYLETKDLKTGQILNNQCNSILLQCENYPDLQSDEQFLYLQKQLTKIENELQAARRIYNIDVTNYNNLIDSFPSSLLANFFKLEKEDFFEISEIEAKNPEIK